MFLINNLLVPSYGIYLLSRLSRQYLRYFGYLVRSQQPTVYDVSCASKRVVGLRAINAGADLILFKPSTSCDHLQAVESYARLLEHQRHLNPLLNGKSHDPARPIHS